MKGKILTVQQSTEVANNLNNQNKKIVLVGGCFDILHVGHIEFLKGAKKKGGTLFVLLESDENIKKIKGHKRPINTQGDRATILSSLSMVDYVIPLPVFKNNFEYDKLVSSLKPAIIATTKGDLHRTHKERQAALIGAKVVDVVEPITNQSTTKLVKILEDI